MNKKKKRNLKIYISGKITGDPDYKAKFARVAAALEKKGYTVLNPGENPDGMTMADYMHLCFAMMDISDVVYFMPDWESSKGANLEMAWCKYTGKPFTFDINGSFFAEAEI